MPQDVSSVAVSLVGKRVLEDSCQNTFACVIWRVWRCVASTLLVPGDVGLGAATAIRAKHMNSKSAAKLPQTSKRFFFFLSLFLGGLFFLLLLSSFLCVCVCACVRVVVVVAVVVFFFLSFFAFF